MEAFKKLVQSCTDELDTYSRFIGRNPDKKSTMQAALLLPPALHAAWTGGPIAVLRRNVSEIMGTRATASMDMRKMLQIAGFEAPQNGGRLQAAADQLSGVLDLIDYAIESDRSHLGRFVSDRSREHALFGLVPFHSDYDSFGVSG